jgi:hypothetical protein
VLQRTKTYCDSIIDDELTRAFTMWSTNNY